MKDLTQGKEWKQIINFAIPMLLGNVFQQLYNIIDSIIVGKYLGTEALGAIGASFPLLFLLIAMVIGLASGSTIIVAQFFGAKQFDNVKKAIDTTYIVLFIASLIVTVVGLLFSESIFKMIKLPQEILPEATIYFNIIIAGSIAMFGFNGTAAILRGLGDSKTPLVFLVISTILNIFFDYAFIVWFGFGVEGAAYATVIAQGGAFVTAIWYLNKNHKIIQISLLKLKFSRELFIKSVRIGLPSGIQQSVVALGMIALLRIVNDFGAATVAAYSVAGRIDSFAAMPAMNFAAALTTFVGQNLGAKKLYRVKKGLVSTIIMTTIYTFIISFIAIFFGDNLMRLFSNDPEVISIGEDYLIIVGYFYILFTYIFVFGAVFRGAGDTIVPMFITFIALWIVRVPMSYLLSREMGAIGIWWGIPAGWAVGMTLSIIYYFIGRWKKKVVVDKPGIEPKDND